MIPYYTVAWMRWFDVDTSNTPSAWQIRLGFLSKGTWSKEEAWTTVRIRCFSSKSMDQTVPYSSQQSKLPSINQEQETGMRSKQVSIGKRRTVFEQANTRYTDSIPVDVTNCVISWEESIEHLLKIEWIILFFTLIVWLFDYKWKKNFTFYNYI